MTQKILKVGTSAAVTIPKQAMKRFGIRIGDRVDVEVDENRGAVKIRALLDSIDQNLVDWTQTFIDRYRPALEKLAKK